MTKGNREMHGYCSVLDIQHLGVGHRDQCQTDLDQ